MSAAVYSITKSSTTISLVASPYYIAGDLPIGTVPRDFEVLSGPALDLPQVSAYATSDVRVLPWAVEIHGSTAQDTEDKLNALLALLPQEGELTTLAVQRTDGSAQVELRCIGVRNLDCPYDVGRDAGKVALLSCELVCQPFVFASPQTVVSDTGYDAPAVVDLTAMTTQFPAPLDIYANGAALELSQCFIGRYPKSCVVGDLVKELVGATWSAGAAAADAAGYGTGVGGNTCWGHTAAAYTDIDVTALEHGEYLVLAKCKTADGADPGTIQQAYGSAVTVSNTALQWLPLGTVTLPTSAVYGSAVSTLRLTITGAGAGDDTYVNAVAFVPVSWGGVVGWKKASGHAHTLRWEDDTLYADDLGDLSNAYGERLLCAKGGYLLIIAEQATPAASTHVHLTITSEPRLEQLPSA